MVDLEAEAYVALAKGLVLAIRRLRTECGVSPAARPVALICGPELPAPMYGEICHLAKLRALERVE